MRSIPVIAMLLLRTYSVLKNSALVILAVLGTATLYQPGSHLALAAGESSAFKDPDGLRKLDPACETRTEDAYRISRQFILKAMNEHSNAQFPDWPESSAITGKCQFLVTSHVDVDDSSGTGVRIPYSLALRFDHANYKWIYGEISLGKRMLATEVPTLDVIRSKFRSMFDALKYIFIYSKLCQDFPNFDNKKDLKSIVQFSWDVRSTYFFRTDEEISELRRKFFKSGKNLVELDDECKTTLNDYFRIYEDVLPFYRLHRPNDKPPAPVLTRTRW